MLPWRRHRRASSAWDPQVQADTWQVCSLLLDYPGDDVVARLPLLRKVVAGLPEQVAEPLDRFLTHAQATDPVMLQQDYVATFDVTRKCALHLTYFLHGDTRNRGAALVRFKQLYRQHGVQLADEDAELPDHLAVVLEFGASVHADTAWKLLNDHRVGIELLRRALERRGSPWLDVIRAVRATLPALDDDDEVALARLIAQGPPQEAVGLGDDLQAPYARDPALDRLGSPPSACGGAPASGATDLGPTIAVGAPR